MICLRPRDVAGLASSTGLTLARSCAAPLADLFGFRLIRSRVFPSKLPFESVLELSSGDSTGAASPMLSISRSDAISSSAVSASRRVTSDCVRCLCGASSW